MSLIKPAYKLELEKQDLVQGAAFVQGVGF